MARPKKKPAVEAVESIMHEKAVLTYGQLALSDVNVRKFEVVDIERLSGSIQSVGLLQNLVVIPPVDGSTLYEIVAGKRRFMALTHLFEAGVITKDYEINVLIVAREHATSYSLTENLQRQAMHPIDEVRAYAKMVEESKTVAEIALIFGETEQHVYQRLAVANASPELQDQCLAGNLSLGILKVLGQIESHEKQNELWESLASWDKNERSLRRLISSDKVDLEDNRVLFVGLDEYKKQGGRLVEDLFSVEPEHSYITDVDLLNEMVADKLATLESEYKTQGWGWVSHTMEYFHAHSNGYVIREAVNRDLTDEEIKAVELLETEIEDYYNREEPEDEEAALLETEEHDANEAKLKELTESFLLPIDKATCGVVLSIGHDGNVKAHEYLVNEKELIAEKEAEQVANGGAVEGGAKDAEKESTMPNALSLNLTANRALGLQAKLMKDGDVALVLMVHDMVVRSFYPMTYGKAFFSVEQRSFDGEVGRNFPDNETSIAGLEVSAYRAELKASLPAEYDDLFAHLKGLSTDELLSLMAFCVSDKTTVNSESDSNKYQAMGSLVGLSMSDYWEAGAVNFFKRLNKGQIVETLKTVGIDDFSTLDLSAKKSEVCTEAESLLKLVDATWLPDLLRIG